MAWRLYIQPIQKSVKWYYINMQLSNYKLIICFLYFQEELSKLSEINNSLVIFCMATYGEGDPTDNASAFYEWLKTEEPDLTGVNYAVWITVSK